MSKRSFFVLAVTWMSLCVFGGFLVGSSLRQVSVAREKGGIPPDVYRDNSQPQHPNQTPPLPEKNSDPEPNSQPIDPVQAQRLAEAIAKGPLGDCGVCLDCLQENKPNEVYVTECGHPFHPKCLDMCMKQGRARCPICRAQIDYTQREDIARAAHPHV